jgi:hypothetical protein
MAIPQPTVVDGTMLAAPPLSVGALFLAQAAVDGSVVALPAVSVLLSLGQPTIVSPLVSYSAVRIGETTEITVATGLADVAWYCWYVDGAYVGKTTGPTKTFQLAEGEQLRLEVIPTDDPDFDPIQNAPSGYPARRTLWWVRSLAVGAASYRVDQQEGAEEWETLALVPQETGKWDFSVTTDRLADLTAYTWRIVALDAAGNESNSLTIGPETIVRTPDAPNFSAAFDSDTQTVEFAEV